MRRMLEGRTVIVPGVGPGMGRATALLCAEEGGGLLTVAAMPEDNLPSTECPDELRQRIIARIFESSGSH